MSPTNHSVAITAHTHHTVSRGKPATSRNPYAMTSSAVPPNASASASSWMRRYSSSMRRNMRTHAHSAATIGTRGTSATGTRQPDGTWHLTWLRGSLPEPSSEVRITAGEYAGPVAYGGTVALPRGGNGEIVIHDRTAPRSVNVGFYHEV